MHFFNPSSCLCLLVHCKFLVRLLYVYYMYIVFRVLVQSVCHVILCYVMLWEVVVVRCLVLRILVPSLTLCHSVHLTIKDLLLGTQTLWRLLAVGRGSQVSSEINYLRRNTHLKYYLMKHFTSLWINFACAHYISSVTLVTMSYHTLF